jgi:hypothetical protein
MPMGKKVLMELNGNNVDVSSDFDESIFYPE